MDKLEDEITAIFNDRLAGYASEELDELVTCYEEIESALLRACIALCADYLESTDLRVAGNVVVLNEKPFRWQLTYVSTERVLSVTALPEYDSRARERFEEFATDGIGRIKVVRLLFAGEIGKIFRPLAEAAATIVRRTYALMESTLIDGLDRYRNSLLLGMNEIVQAWAARALVQLASQPFAFSVTNLETMLFSYAFTTDGIAELVRRCNSTQYLEASPFEIVLALLTREMQDAVLSGGGRQPIAIMPYSKLDSMGIHFNFWRGERTFLGGSALVAIDVTSYRNFVLQLNVGTPSQEFGIRAVHENREVLEHRFRANVDANMDRFARVRRTVDRWARTLGRAASIEFLSELFWRVVERGQGR